MTHVQMVQHTIDQARDALTVRRVYGEPIERDGTLLVPAADVRGGGGGGGGGGGDADGNSGSGGGSGFGLKARPVGAFVMRSNGDVEWIPVVDRDRELAIVTIVSVVTLLSIRMLTKRRRHRRR